MKIKLTFLALATLFLSDCCDGVDDITILEETKAWIPYSNGQQQTFTSDKQETITLKAEVLQADFEGNRGKSGCDYKIERKILKLTNSSSGVLVMQFAFQSRNIYIGKKQIGSESEAIFDVTDYNSQITGKNNFRYEFLPEVMLNGQKYTNVIHYFPGAIQIPDTENYFKEYYFVNDRGLVAFKLSDNPDFFYIN
jgi:hypothetical protein